MFLPNRTTQRELDIQKRRDPAAEKEDIWNPNACVSRRPVVLGWLPFIHTNRRRERRSGVVSLSTLSAFARRWKRSNLVFTSFTMGLFCCVVAEFSYWQYFGTYIWFVIIGLRPLGQFLCAIVEEQLQEALLVMPVMTAFDMTCGASRRVSNGAFDSWPSHDARGRFFVEFGAVRTEPRCSARDVVAATASMRPPESPHTS